MKSKLIALAFIIVLTVSGCGNKNSSEDNSVIELTNQSRTVSIQDKEKYTTDLLNLITVGNSESNLIKCKLNAEDIESDAVIEQMYWFNGSIYMQVNNKYMYRFQLNSDNLVESYIKYELEA